MDHRIFSMFFTVDLWGPESIAMIFVPILFRDIPNLWIGPSNPPMSPWLVVAPGGPHSVSQHSAVNILVKSKKKTAPKRKMDVMNTLTKKNHSTTQKSQKKERKKKIQQSYLWKEKKTPYSMFWFIMQLKKCADSLQWFFTQYQILNVLIKGFIKKKDSSIHIINNNQQKNK